MKKIFILFCISFFVGKDSVAQCGRDCNWMVPDSAGINFSTSTPTLFFSKISGCLTTGCGNESEADASISDISGNLLFYSNGFKIYDRNNNVMLNGDSIWCGSSTSNGIVIIPWPEHDSLYFVFYVNSFSFYHPKGVYYSIINMNKNGGYGDVEVNMKNKEAFLIDSMAEQIAAIKHANGRDWWLIGRRANGYFKILVTQNGISDTTFQQTGIYTTDWSVGEITVNRNGNKVGSCNSVLNSIEQLDFDRCSGQLSNWIFHDFGSDPFLLPSYGCCFSPDGNILYCTTFDTLYQLKKNGNNLDIIYKVANPYLVDYSFFQMELAPNNIIYMAMSCSGGPCNTFSSYDMSLCTINKPDSVGTSCDLQLNNFYLGGKKASVGLPNMPNYNLSALEGSACDTLTSIQNENLKTKSIVSIYPNPATNQLTVESAGSKQFAEGRIEITNSLGVTVYAESENLKSKTAEGESRFQRIINLKSFPSGIYFIKLYFGDGEMEVKKFVKE